MNTQQTLAGYTTTEDFVNELSKHFKITKICKNDDLTSCFESEAYWNVIDIESKSYTPNKIDISEIQTSGDLGKETWGTEVIGLLFANGTMGLMAYNPDCKQEPYSNQIQGTSCIALVYDTSGLKSPNTYGKDIRGLNATLKGECAFKAGGACFGVPFYPTPLTKAECEAVKDELGIESCPYDTNDRWAGAVKACGGVDKMLTEEQIDAMANYVYNTSGLTISDYIDGLKRDDEKLAELGFSFETLVDDSVSMWAGQVDISQNVNGASHAAFGPNSVHGRCYTNRNGITEQAVCLIK